jgi:hypothetical protein
VITGRRELRVGRSGGSFHAFPCSAYGTYFCSNGGAVWAPADPDHAGINESNPIWTVHTAPESGRVGTLVARTVVKAWFVGTYYG